MIYLYTSRFPYEQIAESFLSAELKVASSLGQEVTLVPMKDDKKKRQVPGSVLVDRPLCKMGVWLKALALLKVFLPGSLSFWRCCKDDEFSWRYIGDAVKYLFAAQLVYEDIRQKTSLSNQSVFYSYWLSYGPLAFAAYKQEYPNCQHVFISRGHGSDIYSTLVGVYYPMRKFVLQGLDRVFVVSDYGRSFLQKKYAEFSSKIELSRLGVIQPSSISPSGSDSVKRVVSCSSLVSLKRIDLLYASLISFVEATGISIEWHHFGGGELFDDMQQKIKQKTTSQLHCCLHGMVDNEKILEFYEYNHIDCLISVSTTEGVPVSMMEAISHGIPLLSTDVGGCKEIVTNETGLLLPQNYSQEEFNSKLSEIIENRETYTKSTIDFYNATFNAEHNYSAFYQIIHSLSHADSSH